MTKITKNNVLTFVMLSLLVLNSVTIVYLLSSDKRGRAGHEMPMPPDAPPGPPAPPVKELLKERVGLSNEQVEKFEKLKEQHKNLMEKNKSEIREKREALFLAIKTGNDSVASNYAKEIGEIHAKMEFSFYNHFKTVRGMCNEQQEKEFDKMLVELSKMTGPPSQPPALDAKPGLRPDSPAMPSVADSENNASPTINK